MSALKNFQTKVCYHPLIGTHAEVDTCRYLVAAQRSWLYIPHLIKVNAILSTSTRNICVVRTLILYA